MIKIKIMLNKLPNLNKLHSYQTIILKHFFKCINLLVWVVYHHTLLYSTIQMFGSVLFIFKKLLLSFTKGIKKDTYFK